MSKIRNFEKGKYYHIYSRGVEKRKIFLDEKDYERFYKSISFFNSNKSKQYKLNRNKTKEKQIVKIISFELMPNHFHIKIKEIIKGGISKYMQKLITSYTMYFNKKYNRFGALFGTTFKEKLIENDSHFKYLDFYIKYNCIKIIRPNYNPYEIFLNLKKLNKEELKFVKEYPYYYDYKVKPGTSSRFNLVQD